MSLPPGRAMAKRLPAPARAVARSVQQGWNRFELARMRESLFVPEPQAVRDHPLGRWRVDHTDSRNLYIQYKDEFVHGIYDFDAQRDDPVVIDGGANVGLSILRVLERYPAARITAFEPDPTVLQLLDRNLRRNGVEGSVTVVPAALGGQRGSASFTPDGTAGGRLGDDGEGFEVDVDVLSEHLETEVDFLKLNIEGAELDVLQECARRGRLRNVRQMVVEYHGWPEGEQRLGALLTLLAEEGFRYLVHDFDAETNATTKPPFRITGAPYFLLIYARREERGGP